MKTAEFVENHMICNLKIVSDNSVRRKIKRYKVNKFMSQVRIFPPKLDLQKIIEGKADHYGNNKENNNWIANFMLFI